MSRRTLIILDVYFTESTGLTLITIMMLKRGLADRALIPKLLTDVSALLKGTGQQ